MAAMRANPRQPNSLVTFTWTMPTANCWSIGRGDHNRLGMALQIVTARFLGTFLDDPTDVPAGVIVHLATRLDVPTTTDLTQYRLGDTRWDHATEIRERFGYRDFADQPEHFRLVQ